MGGLKLSQSQKSVAENIAFCFTSLSVFHQVDLRSNRYIKLEMEPLQVVKLEITLVV